MINVGVSELVSSTALFFARYDARSSFSPTSSESNKGRTVTECCNWIFHRHGIRDKVYEFYVASNGDSFWMWIVPMRRRTTATMSFFSSRRVNLIEMKIKSTSLDPKLNIYFVFFIFRASFFGHVFSFEAFWSYFLCVFVCLLAVVYIAVASTLSKYLRTRLLDPFMHCLIQLLFKFLGKASKIMRVWKSKTTTI